MKIFIDPGHGGKDPGARNQTTGLTEAFVTLDVAQKLKRILQKRQYNILMSRNSDNYVSLFERANKANEWDADYFVSIHCNSNHNSYATGSETFYYKHGIRAESFADIVQQQLILQIKTLDRGIKTANFAVLRLTKMPAILVEIAFISNEHEAYLLGTSSFREQCAQGIADGITEYLRSHQE